MRYSIRTSAFCLVALTVSACGGGQGASSPGTASASSLPSDPAGSASAASAASSGVKSLAADSGASAPLEAASAASSASPKVKAAALPSTGQGAAVLSTAAASPSTGTGSGSSGHKANANTAVGRVVQEFPSGVLTPLGQDAVAPLALAKQPAPSGLVAGPSVRAQALAAPATPSAPPSPVQLTGAGVPGPSASNCTAPTRTDFIANPDVWTQVRLSPRDCALLRTANPGFAWTSPANRDASKPFVFTLRNATTNAVVETRNTSFSRSLIGNRNLVAGSYSWSVSYTDRGGVLRSSAARRFDIAAGADLNTVPAPEQVVSRSSAKPRPRLLPGGVSLATVVSRAGTGEAAAGYALFMARADEARSQPLSANPDGSASGGTISSLRAYTSAQALRKAAEAERQAIEALGYAALFRNNSASEAAALTRLRSLINWSPTGATSDDNNDQANYEVLLGLAQGWDLLGHRLSSAEAAALAANLRVRLQAVVGKFASLNGIPYDSHQITASGYATEALLYVVGHPNFPEAQALLATAYETFVTTLDTWGVNGGWANGDAYGWYALSTMPRQVAALRLVTGANIAHLPAVSRLGDNMLAFTAHSGRSRSAFGDDVENTSHYEQIGFDGYRLLADLTRNTAQEWYWRQLPANVTPRYALGPEHFMMRGLLAARPSAAAPSSNSYVFEDVGHTAVHSSTQDPQRSSVFFRSSPLGALNHGHADQNSYVFRVKGQDLLISGGYYPWYQSPHHAAVTRATRFKNALTFDGGIGQAEPVTNPKAPGKPVFAQDPSGRLLNFFDDGTWAVSTGDASRAYRGRDPSALTWTALLDNAVRSLAYNRSERVLLVYDWATANRPLSWELNHQFPVAPLLPGQGRVQVSQGGQSACLSFHAPSGQISTEAGFPIAPENGASPQFRAQYKVSEPSKVFVALTVIREGCRDVPVTVSTNGSELRVVVNGGAPITFDHRGVGLYK